MGNNVTTMGNSASSSAIIAPFSPKLGTPQQQKQNNTSSSPQQQQQQQQSNEQPNVVQTENNGAAADGGKKTPNCKICCACPTERRVRDECVIFKGQENCTEQIESFYTCLLSEGFTQEQVDSLRKRARQ